MKITKNQLNYTLLLLITFFVLGFNFLLKSQSLKLNEVMSSNSLTIADEDGDYEDWIELYNGSSQDIDLTGYFLSDDELNPQKWKFEDVSATSFPQANIIPAGAYKVIFASDKDRPSSLNGFTNEHHTNFKISANGEKILLSDSTGILVDIIDVPSLLQDISYGRQPDGTENLFLFNEPTPGAINSTAGYLQVLEPPVFSHESGFYSQEFNLSLTSPDEGETIYYTLDGSSPDPDNVGGSTYQIMNTFPNGDLIEKEVMSYQYTGAILVQNRNTDTNDISTINTRIHNNNLYPFATIEKATTIRAISVKPGYLPSNVISKTFFVSPDINTRFDLSVVSLMTDNKNFFDYNYGNYVGGHIFNTWQIDNPTATPNGESPANYNQKGDAWERPVNIEIFEPGGETGLNHFGGYRTHGGATTEFAQKSLRFYARSEYGESEFKYKIFPDLPHTDYKRFLLRNSGNDADNTMLRDGFMQSLVKHLNIGTMAYRPAVVFLNGEYWGIHNLRERHDKYYLNQTYGVNENNIDLLENEYAVVEGDDVHFKNLRNFVRDNDMSVETNYDYVKTQMDVESFIDYQLSNIFFANYDWPDNNIRFWRNKVEFDPNTPYGHDGRWRWLLHDTDFGFGVYNPTSYQHNTLVDAIQGFGASRVLLSNLLNNSKFRNKFINTASDLLNTAFLTDRVINVLNACSLTISHEIPHHIERWRHFPDWNGWNEKIDIMKTFAQNRPLYLRDYIVDFFSLQGVANITLNVPNKSAGYLRINSINIDSTTIGLSDPDNPYPWSGIYFKGIPIEIEAIPNPGYLFKGWAENDTAGSSLLNLTPNDDIILTAVFEENPEVVELVHYWDFNNLPSGTLTSVNSDLSINRTAVITYPGTDAGYLDRVSDGSSLNLKLASETGFALRVRNPSETRELLIDIPTTFFEKPVFSFAVKRTSNGAQQNSFYYSTSRYIPEWNKITADSIVIEEYKLFTLNLDAIEDARNNPFFKLKILYNGSNASLDEGNNRYDNLSLEGVLIDTIIVSKTISEETDSALFGATNLKLELTAENTSSVTAEFYYNISPAPGSLPDGVDEITNYFWRIIYNNLNFSDARISVPLLALPNVDDSSRFVWLARSGSSEEWTNIGGLIINDDLVSNVPFNSFSEFVIGVMDNIVSVELSSFTANTLSNSIMLKWSTASETNNFGFNVEKRESEENSQWEKAGFIRGNGTSVELKEYTFEDKNPYPGKSFYRLKQIDLDGSFKYLDEISVDFSFVPDQYFLDQNFPNPFNPSTKIRFGLPSVSEVTLKVYNILGNEVATLINEMKPAGRYEINFNTASLPGVGSGLASGVYFYSLIARSVDNKIFKDNKKMILIR